MWKSRRDTHRERRTLTAHTEAKGAEGVSVIKTRTLHCLCWGLWPERNSDAALPRVPYKMKKKPLEGWSQNMEPIFFCSTNF